MIIKNGHYEGLTLNKWSKNCGLHNKTYFYLMNKYLLILLLFLLGCIHLDGQSESDFWKIWQNEEVEDSLRLAAIHQLFRNNLKNDPQQALQLVEQQYAFAKDKKQTYWQSKALNNFGRYYLKKDNYEKSLSYYQQSLAVIQQLHLPKGEAVLSGNIARLYHKKLNQLDKAIDYQKMSVKASEVAQDYKYQIKQLYYLGDLYRNDLDFSATLIHYLHGIELSQRENHLLDLIAGYQNVANFYDLLEDFERALTYHRKALNISLDIEHQKGIAYSYNNFGNIYRHQEKLDSALYFYQKSLSIKTAIKDSLTIPRTLHNIGNIYLAKNENQQAEKYFQLSLQKQKNIQNKRDLSNLYCALGELQIAYNNYEQAISWCEKGYQLSTKIQQIDRQIINCKCLALAYEKWSKAGRALAFQKKVITLRDSFKNIANYLEVSQLEMEHELKNAKVTWQQQQNSNTMIFSNWLWCLVILLLLAVLLVAWKITTKKRSSPIEYSQEEESPSPKLLPPKEVIEKDPDMLWLEKVDQLIDQSIEVSPSLKVSDLAAQLFLSDRHLRRKLTALTGLTPNKYIIEYKLKKAQRLLEQQVYPSVKETMYYAGFKNRSYFSKLYLERFGVSPSSYFS